jgi:cellobiose phosphorylase
MPQQAKTLIKQLLRVQKRNGSAMHQFNPLTMVASEGDSLERPDLPHYYSDDHLWIILAVCAYLKETGDRAFLDEAIPYYDSFTTENAEDAKKLINSAPSAVESGTVLEHLRLAVEFTRQDVGAHGLPLLGFADWNDTINLYPGAESLFTANLYGKALLEMIELSCHLGDAASAEQYAKYYSEMKERVNQHAWDGEWYIRYLDSDGTPRLRANDHRQITSTASRGPSSLALPRPSKYGRRWTRCARGSTRPAASKSALPALTALTPSAAASRPIRLAQRKTAAFSCTPIHG